jgi:BirA family biotin operon repressor/biotin-[acetyl-CoA-carboxylase] ligase
MKSTLDLGDLFSEKGSYISGEELGQKLGVSRTAVWKQVQKLREEGFGIEAIPKLGYRIVSYPNKLLPPLIKNGLGTSVLGREIRYFPTFNSTNAEARKFAEEGAPEGTLVVSESQTKGKGRYGRGWISPERANILASVILRPAFLPSQVPQIAIIGALSVAEAIFEMTKIKAHPKWPNEVLIGGKKVSGILTEFGGELDKIDFVILGVGLNVNFNFDEYPELQEKATSLLQETGEKVSRIKLLQAFLEHLEENYNSNFDLIREKWESVCWELEKEVKVISGEKTRIGVAKGIGEDGNLILATEKGEESIFMTGGILLEHT